MGKKYLSHKGLSVGGWVLGATMKAIGSLPLRVLYGISDAVAFMAGNVVGYRRKVIRRNLEGSFPGEDKERLREIEKKFYHFLGDYFVETLHLGSMSEKEIRGRMRFENVDDVNECLREGKDVTLYLGHYCNWEWLSSIPLHTVEGACAGQIYHPLENRAFDDAFLKIRGRFGATSIKMNDTLRVLMRWRREGRPSIVGYIADQAPLYDGTHYYADFLNHDTPVFTGPERLSRMLHAAVFYCDVRRPRRGEYVCRYVKMTDDASKLPQFELTARYFALLEESIRREPHLWLWSHNRWKRSRADFFGYYGEEEARRRLSHL